MTSALVLDCEGARLSDDERALFREIDPWGFILFARHCASAEAARAHCDELRECVGRDAPILIDQEGGRVARMKPPVFPAHRAPAAFGELWRLDPEKAREAARLNARLLGRMVSDLGVTVNCAPSLDTPQIDADPATVGDRAVAKHPETIAALGEAMIEGALEGGVAPVIKHMPGLGRVLCDSHHELPRVSAGKNDLQREDFSPFKALASAPAGMTCHVVYEALDPDAPATLSQTIIHEIIRGEIGFDGLLFTDDLKMKALGGPYDQRVAGALDAGCDIAVACNLNFEEKQQAARGARVLTEAAQNRANAAMARIPSISREDTADAYRRLEELLRPVSA